MFIYEQKKEIQELFPDCDISIKVNNIYARHDNRELFRISPLASVKIETESGFYIFSIGMSTPGVNVIQMISENGKNLWMPKIVIHYNY